MRRTFWGLARGVAKRQPIGIVGNIGIEREIPVCDRHFYMYGTVALCGAKCSAGIR